MELRTVMHMGEDQLHPLELIHRIFLNIVPHGLARSLGTFGHERQLEDLRFCETTGLVGRQAPDDVGYAVTGLVEKLSR